MKNQFRFARGFIFVCAFALTTPLIAADHFVDVFDNRYSPSSLEINVGDTVIWINQDEDDFPHTVISDDGEWIGNGPMYGFGETFAHTFTTEGIFSYHESAGFTGSITVVPATPPPADITLSSFQIVGGKFEFQFSGLIVGATNVVQVSTNLIDWTGLSTNVASSDSFGFTNAINASAVAQFFRVVQLQ